MEPVYFDSSLFIAIFNGEKTGPEILELLRELKKRKMRVVTSIITIQEVSVVSFRLGTVAADHYSRVHRFARVEGITKDISLTAAKFEAQILDSMKAKDAEVQRDNRRRKWDCFHIATALCLGCKVLYSADKEMRARKQQLGIKEIEFCEPSAAAFNLPLFKYAYEQKPQSETQPVTGTPELRSSGDGPAQNKTGTEEKAEGQEI